METFKLLLYILIGYASTYSFLLLPSSNKLYKPFIWTASEQLISAQAYVDYLCTRGFYCLLIFVVKSIAPDDARHYLNIVFWLFVGYILDYFLFYNQPVGYLQGTHLSKTKPESGFYLPLSYSLIVGIVIAVLCLLSIK